MSLFCCDGGGPCAQSSRMRVEASGPAPIVPDSQGSRVQTPLPMLQDWDKLGAREKEVVQEKLESIVNAFARELTRGKAQCKFSTLEEGQRRAKTLQAVERRAAKIHYREELKKAIFDETALERSREASLRYHIFRTERPLSQVEKRRGQKALRPFGFLPRLRPADLLQLVEGPAQAHSSNPLLWGELEKLFLVHGKVLSIGELARVLYAFAMRHRQHTAPLPLRLLRLASRRIQEEVFLCSTTELADALEAFGTFSVRELKLLEKVSNALPAICEEGQPMLGQSAARLGSGLAQLRWPDPTALQLLTDFAVNALKPKEREVAPRKQRNLFQIPRFEPEEHDPQLTKVHIVRICESFAALEVRSEPLIRAVLVDFCRGKVKSGEKPWDRELLGRLGSSLGRLGVTHAEITSRWLRAVRAEDRQDCQPKAPGWLLEVATTANLLGAFHREFQLRVGRRLRVSLRLGPPDTLPMPSLLVPAAGDVAPSNQLVTGLPSVSSAVRQPPAEHLKVALRCLEVLSCMDDADCLPVFQAALRHVEGLAAGDESPVLLPLLSMSFRLPKDDQLYVANKVFSKLDIQPAKSFSNAELLEAHRCSARLRFEGAEEPQAGGMGHFEQRCPSLAKVLWQRLRGILVVSGEQLEDAKLRQLASFASVAEVLRSSERVAVTGEEANLAVSCSRTLRVKLASEPTLSLGTAVSMAEWFASTPVPAGSEVLCRQLSAKVKLMEASSLRRTIAASLTASFGTSPASWLRVLHVSSKDLRRKIYLQPADWVMRLAVLFLQALARGQRFASCRPKLPELRRTQRIKHGQRVQRMHSVQRVKHIARVGAAAMVRRLLKPGMLSQVSILALEESLGITQSMRRRPRHEVSKLAPFILLDGHPSVREHPKVDELRIASPAGCFLGRCICSYQQTCRQFTQSLQQQVAFRSFPKLADRKMPAHQRK
ncbi:unnamed protein product [Effrenium voratum]|nr:unnamed protein product [Effrenium voratum]